MVAHACNTWDLRAGGSRAQGWSELHTRLCLKKKKKKKKGDAIEVSPCPKNYISVAFSKIICKVPYKSAFLKLNFFISFLGF
jgi:hypothetical protein